jgi:5'-3' exonuclease
MNLADRVRANSQVTLLLDCNGICHALRHTIGALSHNGKETGIVFGFLLQLFTLQKRFRPYRWVFAWDSGHSLRRKIYPQYKGNRAIKRNPEEEWHRQSSFRQFDLLRDEVIPELGLSEWNLYEHGYEADDLIASAVSAIPGKKIIISQDHDLYQLLGENCVVYNSKKRELFSSEDFRKQYGIDPKRWVEVKAIAGCSGDNVEGIFHAGEASAIKYLTGELSTHSKVYCAITTGREIIERNRQLVELPFDGFRLSERPMNRMHMSEVGFQSVCQLYGFDSFLSGEKLPEWRSVFGWNGR